MSFMSAMEHALQVGTAQEPMCNSRRKPTWPTEFRDPVDAALHLGTPPKWLEPVKPRRSSWKIFEW